MAVRSELLVSFDTSTLLYYLGRQNLRSRREAEEAVLVQGLGSVLRNEKKILFKTSASQLEKHVTWSEDGQSNRKRGVVFDGAGTDRMNEIRERIEAEGFEDYTNRIGSHREMLENITGRQLWMRNHPDTDEAVDWIHRKYGHKYSERGIRRMRRDERRGILDGLCREAGRGGDALLLAQAATLAGDHNVLFISNDGDHVTLDEYMGIITRGRLRVTYPCDVRAFLSKSGRLQDTQAATSREGAPAEDRASA